MSAAASAQARHRFELYVATKMYSSWSLRAWLACRVAVGNDFDEVKLPIAGADAPAAKREEVKQTILRYSPTGKVPALLDRGINAPGSGALVYESIAIVLHLADHLPSSGLLPSDPLSKALCISACAEMHAGFTALRSAWPMNCVSVARGHGAKTLAESAALQSDIARLAALFSELRTKFGSAESGGKYLFGAQFSAADCMYGTVAFLYIVYLISCLCVAVL